MSKKTTNKKLEIKSKTVYTMQISPDFSVEAEINGDWRDFWLVRKGRGKTFLLAIVPKEGIEYAKTMKGELRKLEFMLTDPTNDMVRLACEKLLDSNTEALAEGSFDIISK